MSNNRGVWALHEPTVGVKINFTIPIYREAKSIFMWSALKQTIVEEPLKMNCMFLAAIWVLTNEIVF